jgi:hypothetical protein
MSKVTGMDPIPLNHILDNLRPDDEEELTAVRGEGFDRMKCALQLCQLVQMQGSGWIFWRPDTGAPVAVLGSYAMTPTCAGCWAFGTTGWPFVVRGVTRHIRKVMVPTLLKAGFHRAECRALARREDTKIWLTSLGWKAEAALSEFGVRHEDFTLFAWLANEHSDHDRQP